MSIVAHSLNGITPQSPSRAVNPTTSKVNAGGNSAGPEALTFSRHLHERINRRSIEFSNEKLTRLTQAVDKAANKGSRDSVVLLDNLAVLVNVTKRTILTAIETEK